MKKTLIFSIAILCALMAGVAQDAKTVTKATLNSVIVYTAGVEMHHKASANLKKGNNELIITDIASLIDINSVQVKAPGTVTILSVEFANHYLAPTEKSEKVKRLEDSLAIVQKELDKTNIAIQNNSNLQKILESNRDIKGSQTGVSVMELTKLMDYYKTKSLELQHDNLQLNEKKTKTDEQILNLRKRIQEELKNEAIQGGRIIVKLSSALAGNSFFELSYISPNAYWIPNYDVNVGSLNDPLKIAFKAKVSQNTGVDWKQVRLSLSTSIPSQYGTAPVLQQWFLYYQTPYAMNGRMMRSQSNMIQAYAADEVAEDLVYVKAEERMPSPSAGSGDKRKEVPAVYVVNGQILSAEDYSQIDQSLVKSNYFLDANSAKSTYGKVAEGGAYIIELKTDLEDYVSVSENSLNMLFEIDMPYDILSNGQSQTIQVQNKEIPAIYKHYNVPKLDPETYLLAEVPNWNSLNLLPGEANIIFENTYVGKTFIEPASSSDTLNLTMGKDKRIVVKRQKVEDLSSNKFVSSNKVQKFTYEITVRNNKNESVNLMLKDQFPLTTMKEVEVDLVETGDAAVNKEIGVLTWRLSLAAGESKKVRYSYTVKYPKDKILNLN